jgi:ketosteroid isomerase-like protein
MTPEAVQVWLDAYIDAWRSYDNDAIGDLFAEDATYAYHPWDEPIRGREAIVASWLSDRDEPNSWSAGYGPFIVSGNRAVAVGETRYADGKIFVNAWQLIFDQDARCSEFVEWYMTLPADPEPRKPLVASAPIDNTRGREGDRCR